jgi:hypothetical protein
MTPEDAAIESIGANLDERRRGFTGLRRVVLDYVGKPLESTAVSMAVPIIYAHWEGYVKEACQLYIEHIERTVPKGGDLQPAVLGQLWTPVLRTLMGGINTDKKRAVAEHAVKSLGASVRFGLDEKSIDTSSNLKFRVLESIAAGLCIDVSQLEHAKHHLDSLVELRNNIAHGARPTTLRYPDFDGHATRILNLMEELEGVLSQAIRSRAFCAAR